MLHRLRKHCTVASSALPLISLILACGLACLVGCQPTAWLAGAVIGEERTVDVKAEYRGLDQKKIAVLVAAPNQVLFEYPRAPLNVCRAASGRIAADIPGAKLSDPQQIIAFQRKNPQWLGVPTGQLIERLNVERLVMIDLAEYSTHEPGNAHLFRGIVVGQVTVTEARRENSNNAAYSQVVSAHFPEDRPLGLLEEDADTIELGMIELFARRVSGLFHDHKVVRR